MKNKKTSFFAGDFDKLARRFALIFALIVPLADTLVFSPLCDTVLANLGDGVLYEILSKFSELAVTSAFLAMCTLAVCSAFAGRTSLAVRFLLLEGLSLVFVAVLLKSAVLWLCAAIDEYLLSELGTFVLSNYTLSQINDNLLVGWSMISYFTNVLPLFAIMGLGLVASVMKISRIRSTGRRLGPEALVAQLPKNPMVNRYVAVPIAAYLVLALSACIADAADTVKIYGAPTLVSEYLFLILPFVYQIGFAVVGYFLCQYIAYVMISRLNKK